jgi:hypothetical protein
MLFRNFYVHGIKIQNLYLTTTFGNNFLYMYFKNFLAVLGFELSALHLLSRHSSAKATTLSLFGLIIFKIGSHVLFRSAWTMMILF